MLSPRRRLIVNRPTRLGRKLTFDRHFGYERRKLWEAYLFWVFLGRFAGHWFYMRRYVIAIAYVVTMVALFGIGMVFPQTLTWIFVVFIVIKIVELFLMPRWVRSSNVIIRNDLVSEFDLADEDWLNDKAGSVDETNNVEEAEL